MFLLRSHVWLLSGTDPSGQRYASVNLPIVQAASGFVQMERSLVQESLGQALPM